MLSFLNNIDFKSSGKGNHIFLHFAFREWELGNHEHDFSRLKQGIEIYAKAVRNGMDDWPLSYMPDGETQKRNQSCQVEDEPMDSSMP